MPLVVGYKDQFQRRYIQDVYFDGTVTALHLRYAAKYTVDLKDRRHQHRLTVYFCLLTWHFVPRPESFAFRRCSGNGFGDREEIASSVFIFKMAVCMVLRITCRSGDILFEMVP